MNYVPLTEDRLPQMCELWNRELGERFPMREELLKQNSFRDANVLPEGSWLAVDEATDQVVGFVVAKIWREQREFVLRAGAGWIQVLLVAREYRGRGIGSELLSRAERALAACGAETILLGKDPWHYFPGIPQEDEAARRWFGAKGYQDDQRVENDLLAVYDGGTGAAEELPALEGGARVRMLEAHEKDELLAFLRRCFPGRWEYEALCYFECGGTGREFVVLEQEGRIVGFCRINDSRSPLIAQNVYWAPLFQEELGGIGPLGVDAAFRGRGYGLAVVQAGVHFLRQRGIRRIVIDWTTLVDFYGKLNYKVWKAYGSYSKRLEQSGARGQLAQ
ncbi:acetyltransferase [Gordoniibacillus kamchatkensis]|uniref:Acetyltransferase n=1 Tax=Gordoniibacillus kamchatkensis TaxID=1590651 RepID=A0ABR5AFL3_9BACL|nr:GNAT family N-acetyltransferase [Paenibacillus sp. VKM B-2647]KIL39840.1 acetyltransferase [Paenibacillus sp. VKM B-2647]